MMRTLLVCFALLAAGCGGEDDGDFDAPTCAEGEVAIEGTLDGDTVAMNYPGLNLYSFVNKIDELEPGVLDIGYDDDSGLHLEWDQLVANGQSVDARGFVNFSPRGGPQVGNCETGAFASTLRMDDDGDGGAFELRMLNAVPFCGGAAVDGELRGCFRAPPSP